MGMVVRTNTMALNAYRQLGMNNSAVSKSLEKLSSGFRINRAGDDAAGLAISEKMKAQITGLETASANAQDGISLIQTAEGALNEVHSMLNRMVELATKSANGTYTQTERDALQDEVNALLTEVDRISQSTNFNGANLLDGSLSAGGNGQVFDGADRILKDVLKAGESAVKYTGIKTVLDAGAGAEAVQPKFKVDFKGLIGGTVGNGTGKKAEVDTSLAKGKDVVEGKSNTVTFDFTGKKGSDITGKSIQIGGTTYSFVTTAGTPGTDEVEVVLDANDDAAKIAEKLQDAAMQAATAETGAIKPTNLKTDDDGKVTADAIQLSGTKVTFSAGFDTADGKVQEFTGGASAADGGAAGVTIGNLTSKALGEITDLIPTGKDGLDLKGNTYDPGNATKKASFTLTLDTNAKIDTGKSGALAIKIGDQIVTSKVGTQAASSANAVAKLFDGTSIMIGDYKFNLTADATAGEIKFEADEIGDLSLLLAKVDFSDLQLESAPRGGGVEVTVTETDPANAVGQTVTIGDKTYEFVSTNGAVKKEGNIKVELATTDNTATLIANRLEAAIKKDLPDDVAEMNVLNDGNGKLTITRSTTGTNSVLKGSATSATGRIANVTIDDNGEDKTLATAGQITVDFTGKTGEDLMNSTLAIDDKVYQFVTEEGKEKEGNIAVVITAEDTDAQIAKALTDTINGDATNNKGENVDTVGFAKDPDTGADVATKVVFTANTTGKTSELKGSAAAGDGSSIKFNFKLANQVLASDVEINPEDKADVIAKEVLAKFDMEGDLVKIGDNKYRVELDGDSLVFELDSTPTKDNIAANFDWDLDVKEGTIEGNHTAGTVVMTPGQFATDSQKANTVFRIEASDIKDGTTITIDKKTVKLAVGENSKLSVDDDDVIDLKEYEAGDIKAEDLDIILSKISEGFKDGTDNFIVGVNDTSNGDKHKGLTVHKNDGSTNNYNTLKKLEDVFKLETGGTGSPLTLQIGDTADSFNKMEVEVANMSASGLGLRGLSVATREDASESLDTIKTAINNVSSARAKMGALQNRLEHTINNLDVAAENLSAANSRIRDTDMAKEMMNYTKMNVLVQSAQAMLAQANQQPQSVLQLLQ